MLAYFSIPVTLINSYEPSVHVIDSMVNQHAKRLEKGNDVRWRMKVSSLNILVSGLIWRQDHNGFTHQDPGFLDVVANKSPSVVRIYLPPDPNCLLSVGDIASAARTTSTSSSRTSSRKTCSTWNGGGDHPLYQGPGHLELGKQRPGDGARLGTGELRRRADADVFGHHRPAAQAPRDVAPAGKVPA